MSGTYNVTIRRVVISAWIGNSIEYYDFLLYGLASALVFGPLFFLTPAHLLQRYLLLPVSAWDLFPGRWARYFLATGEIRLGVKTRY